ncbi:MAG TPA: NAD(+)/NADH kinase [Syntrophomonadaceae bacterium]|nr:NAD(+)/NADH kinase [Syntrophomonadaceae bacterium]
MKVLLVNNRYKESTAIVARDIAALLNRRNISVEVDDGSAEHLLKDTQLVVVLGGDGTILRAARHYGHQGVPILGVNMGTVGFLSNVEVDEFYQNIDRIIQGDYILENRMMLEIAVYKDDLIVDKGYCLNELVVKSKTHQMISFNIDIDDALSYYKGDGVLVSTPTGSTAYSLSCGGPIADPDLEAFIITPIASHINTKKSLIVSPKKNIVISSFSANGAVMSVDGQVNLDVGTDYKLVVKAADHKLFLVDLKNKSFFSTIDSKLRRNEALFV